MNIENIAKFNIPGKCQCCSSSDTEYTAVKIKDDFGYAVIWCNNCKRACNISRIQITDKTVIGKKIPNRLIY